MKHLKQFLRGLVRLVSWLIILLSFVVGPIFLTVIFFDNLFLLICLIPLSIFIYFLGKNGSFYGE